MTDAESPLPPPPPILPDAPDTFCTYLARQLIAKRGYSESTIPEAAKLAEHCDILLIRSDGMTCNLLCLIDREAHPGKSFDMSVDEVKAIGKECLRYTGTVYHNQLPVALQVMEIGPSAADAEQRARLSRFKSGWFPKTKLTAWAIDPATKTLWTNAWFGGSLAGARTFRRYLHGPREDAAQLRPPQEVATRIGEDRFPTLTVSIIAVLCALFLAELMFGAGPISGLLQPSLDTLVMFGGIQRPLVQNGEWTRLFSGPLLHAGLEHLALNCIALYIAGRLLENLVGRAWLAAIFAIGAFTGALFSLAFNPDNLVSVGASGAVMALFAALLMLSFHFPKGPDRSTLRMTSIYVLIPSMIPVASRSGGGQVDIAAHLGGALAGIVLGLLLLMLWRKDEEHPRLAPAAAAIGVAGLALFAFAFTPLPQNYRNATLVAALIPAADYPKSDDEANQRAAELVEKYPRDPRAHYFHAIALWNGNDTAGAEKELRTGLADEASWKPLLVPQVSVLLRVALAVLLAQDDRADEAKGVAQPVCGLAMQGESRELLEKYSLCLAGT